MRVFGALYRACPAALAGAPGARCFASILARRDFEDGDSYRVVGTVAVAGTPDTPVYRRVRLLDRRNGRIVREIWSDPATGAYAFERVRQGPWTVISHDHTGQYNAVVADDILGEPA